MAETNKQKKARLKREKAKRQAEQPIVDEIDEEDDYEEDEDEDEEYTSPLAEKFSNVQEMGEGVLGVHDRANDRIYLDINYGKRRGISSTVKTVKIANATYKVDEQMKLSLNVYDKRFNDEELVEKEKLLIRKAKEVELALKQKELAKKEKMLED